MGPPEFCAHGVSQVQHANEAAKSGGDTNLQVSPLLLCVLYCSVRVCLQYKNLKIKVLRTSRWQKQSIKPNRAFSKCRVPRSSLAWTRVPYWARPPAPPPGSDPSQCLSHLKLCEPPSCCSARTLLLVFRFFFSASLPYFVTICAS